ncbi:CaiB/BaiF CoA transferase family protein [Mycolicibacterium fluoranthenivorans]|uniref:Crotonobetainyl-CoA:carnitine CoA-transferase CaiB-like acyl-CoA transferase n=1 Tax=Mycolicibacterium fluoranthenivorans TaxID=258505 RepID=A0A7X5U2Q2_9MYCO|nr:CoA transferase [Mycolicibacterium fluoranthenivorans]MCV7354162.1 CoA transferase [Mycolicibacterium fluoranthenivorans]NIH97275.1 crotonobetainyl-CoA:carnitine CoA-transferase CaiB-like acyl-CoA transferase [Mycolicibacterium fluoranthenivorans]
MEDVISADKVLAGVRVLEVAAWTFVPAAGAVLAEWGAEVIKVEPRDGGDPQRGLVTMGIVDEGAAAVNYMIEIPNRGKKSIGVDLSTPGGREVVRELAKTADVFLTSYLPNRRKKFGIDVDDIRAVNPGIVYVRGSGHGPKGPDADKPGYDGVSYWARGGIATVLTEENDELVRSRPAFGDLLGGLTIAGGIAAALYKKATTGVGSVVDVSLLGLAAWNLSPDVAVSQIHGGGAIPKYGHADAPNPLVGTYRTKDGRYVQLMMLQLDKFYPEAMHAIGLPELVDDPRFADPAARYQNRGELIRLMDDAFARRTLAEWRAALEGISGAWGIVQTPSELCEDPAITANGYVAHTTTVNGTPFILPTNPVQFDEQQVVPPGAPEHGQHTEEILMDAGLDWDTIMAYKESGAIL